MTVARPRAAAPLPHRLRGPAAGAVCGVGAVLAHAAAGGGVVAAAALVAVLASAALGAALLRGPVERLQTFAVAVVAQVVWHGAFLLADARGGVPGATAPGDSATGMLLTHLLAALVTTVVALGVERELVLAACRRCGLTLRSPGPVVPPRPTPRPALVTVPVAPAAAPLAVGRALRGPPC